MKKWFLVPLFLILATIMVFTGCSTPVATTTTSTTHTTTTTTTTTTSTSTTVAAPYGTLTDVAASFGYDTWDPSLVTSWAQIYQPIMRTTQTQAFEGDVLSSWDISADGNTWTFHLLPNNKFTNGDPVTAADVKFSIERFAASTRSPWAPYLRASYNFVSMTVVDTLTLTYVTAHPEATLMACFGATYVLDKTEFDKVGEAAYFKNPVGSGPWKFSDYVAGTSIKLEANTGYCRPAEVPKFKYYVQLLVPELATRISMFKTGQCDILGLDDYARMKSLQDLGMPIQQYGINGTDSFAFQWSWLPEAGAVHDIRIRQAMSYALNRQEICDTWYSGYAIPGGRFFEPQGIFGYSDALAADPYDVVKAKQLIADANYPAAFSNPTITIFCQSSDQDRMLYYMSYWQAVGLQVKLLVKDTATYWSYLGFGPPQTDNKGWIWFWKSWSYPNSVYHSANMYTSKGVHKTTNDAHADELYAAVVHQSSYQAAWDAMTIFQAYVATLYTNIGVVEYKALFLYNPTTISSFTGRSFSDYASCLQGANHVTH